MSLRSGLPRLVPLVYAVLLLAMAAGQLLDLGGFSDALGAYGLPPGTEEPLAVALPVVEIAAGALLLVHRLGPSALARAGAALGLVVAVGWSVLAAQAFARGLEVPNCGCFGVYLTQELRWWVLLEDVYLLALAAFAARSAVCDRSRGGTSMGRRIDAVPAR